MLSIGHVSKYLCFGVVMVNRNVFRVSVDKLIISPLYFRYMVDDQHVRELANSISEFGLINPLIVRRTNNGKYEIIDGVHRYLALRLLNEKSVKVRLWDGDYISALKFITSTFNNVKKFTVADKMHQIVTLSKHYKMSPVEIAKKLGINPKTVERYLLVWQYLDEEEKRKLAIGELSFRKALMLAQERKEGRKRKYICALCNDYVDYVKPVYLCPSHAETISKLASIIKLLPSLNDTLRVLSVWNDVVNDLVESNVLDEKYVRVMNFLNELILTVYKG